MRKRLRSRRGEASALPGILLKVDNGPLRQEAWDRLQAARKRLTRATAELHRHESEDTLAYVRWTYATCPTLISEIRELHEQIQSLASLIERVQAYAFHTGRSPESIWQEFKGDPPTVPEEEDDAFAIELEDAIDEEIAALAREFEADSPADDRDTGEAGARATPGPAENRRRGRRDHEIRLPQPARDIYRRLVQQLHPDRGGEWTPQREALWHEVQLAWEARDADWLARLEAEYEIAADTLTVDSPVGRLYAALREIEGARRDAERKLRQYRKAPAWRFTLKKRGPADAARLAEQLRSDRELARHHLAYLEQRVAQWARPLGQARAKRQGGSRRSVFVPAD